MARQYRKYTKHIYMLLDPRTKEPRYVGITENPKQRILNIWNGTPEGTPLREWIDELKAEGCERPEMVILERFKSELRSDNLGREAYWIRRVNRTASKPLLNVINGPMSDRHRGRGRTWNRGVVVRGFAAAMDLPQATP